MNIEFTPKAWEEMNYWIQNDASKVEKINELIRSIRQNPFKGMGSHEPLKHSLKGFWSRRIDSEHRLVYRVAGIKDEQKIQIVQCRYHYNE
ncbi:MAG: Txe/YoeB family addiction module toxin [Saprospiraceae bacterium]